MELRHCSRLAVSVIRLSRQVKVMILWSSFVILCFYLAKTLLSCSKFRFFIKIISNQFFSTCIQTFSIMAILEIISTGNSRSMAYKCYSTNIRTDHHRTTITNINYNWCTQNWSRWIWLYPWTTHNSIGYTHWILFKCCWWTCTFNIRSWYMVFTHWLGTARSWSYSCKSRFTMVGNNHGW
jgi:hypothetical protein